MKRRVVLTSALLAALVVGASHAPADTSPQSKISEPTIVEIARSYRSYRGMTEQAVFVNPELAMLCIGASQNQVEAARKVHGPHAHSAIQVYMNEIAARDFGRGDGVYAPGAVVVKQKTLLGYRDGKSGTSVRTADHGVGGMVKRAPGFDPAHGDWEYFYFEDSAKIESGRIASCITCHDTAKATGYVFGTWATPPGKKG